MTEEKVSRRGYLKYAGAGVVVVAGAAAGAYYATRPQGPVETITTMPTMTTASSGMPFEGVTLNVIVDEWRLSDTVLPYLGQEFQRRTGGRVNVISVPYDELHDKIFIELANKSGAYDIIMPDGAWSGEVMGGGFAEALDDLIKSAEPDFDYNDVRGKEFGEWDDGRIYGLPSNLHSNAVLCYHTDLWEEQGVTPPNTWEEFDEIAKMFTGYTTKSGEKVPYGISDCAIRDDPIIMQWMIRWDNYGGWRAIKPCKGQPGLWSENWEPYFNSDKAVECTDMWKNQLLKYGPPGMATFGWDEQVRLFQDRKAAMTTSWTCNIWSWEIEGSPTRGKIGYTLPPVKPGEKRCGLNATREYFIPVDSKQKDAAWEFVKMATTKEMDVKAQGNLWGCPMRASTFANPETGGLWPWVKAINDWSYFDVIIGEPQIPEWYEVKEHLGRGLSEIVTETKTVKAGLDDAADGVRNVFERAGYYGSQK